MRSLMFTFIISISLVMLFPLHVFCQSNQTISITTYYPAPHGVYRSLRLYPSTSEPVCSASQEGRMYYNNASFTDNLRICHNNGTGYYWMNMSAEGPGLWQLSGNDINNTNAGNVVISNNSNVLFSLKPGAGANDRESAVRFWSTFDSYPADTFPRLAGRVQSGFNGGIWGTEYMAFGVGNNGAANDAANPPLEKMRITCSGNVGIGTATPSQKLEVIGSINVPAGSDICIGGPGGKCLSAASTSTTCVETPLTFVGEGCCPDCPAGYSRVACYTVSYTELPIAHHAFVGLAGTCRNCGWYDDLYCAQICCKL